MVGGSATTGPAAIRAAASPMRSAVACRFFELITTPARGIASRRSPQASLAERSYAALIRLYACDSRLSRAQAEAAGLRAQAASLSGAEAVARVELRVARHTLELAQRRLGDELRAL